MNVTVSVVVPSTASSQLIEQLEALLHEILALPGVNGVELDVMPTCSSCGCTDEEACLGGCAWVERMDEGDERFLCSSCVAEP